MPTVANVTAGKPKVTGAVFRAPAGTTMPTDASTALSSTFVELGYISDDGVSNANSPSTEKVNAWGGAVVLVTQTDKPDDWKMKLLEVLNPEVLKTVYGDSAVTVTTSTGAIAVKASGAEAAEHAYVIDMAMKGGVMKRICIPAGVLSEVADIVYKDNEAVGYEVTISALPDSSGNSHYEYILPPATSGSGST